MANFSANLPSSLLAATCGHCLFTPKVFLQKKDTRFFNFGLFPEVNK